MTERRELREKRRGEEEGKRRRGMRRRTNLIPASPSIVPFIIA